MRMKTSLSCLLLLALSLTPLAHPLEAEELHGKIELLAKGGKAPAKTSDVRQAVIYFEPAGPVGRAAEKTYEMITKNKAFVPRILAVPKGARVRFPNADPILHNVFSVSTGNAFDLGLYKSGPGKEKTFENPGVVRVYCNVHQSMVASILVVDTPYFTMPGADGAFALAGLPKGPGKLTVWHEQTEPWTISVQLPAGPAPITARLEVTRPQLPPHLDKTGKSYFASGRDEYRH
jgi:plastocyanin